MAGSGLIGKEDGASLASASFSAPHGLVWDATQHQIWVADADNACIRFIQLPGL